MPTKAHKHYQLLLKTHTLTIFLTAPPNATVAFLKHEAFNALVSDVNQVDDVPVVTSEDDFEICKVRKGKDKRSAPTYDVLDGSLQIKSCLSNWQQLFLQFRDESGELMPVEYTEPALTYDDDDESRDTPGPTFESSPSKGKRKAPGE